MTSTQLSLINDYMKTERIFAKTEMLYFWGKCSCNQRLVCGEGVLTPLQTETGAPLLQRYFAVIVGVTLVYEGYQTWFHGAQGRDDELELFTAYASIQENNQV